MVVRPNHINFLKPDRPDLVISVRLQPVSQIGYQFDNYYPRVVLDTLTNRDNAYAIEDFDGFLHRSMVLTLQESWRVDTKRYLMLMIGLIK